MKNNSVNTNAQKETKKKNATEEVNKEEKNHDIEHNEWKDKYLRALADYHNLEQRVENQIKLRQLDAKKKLLLSFLSILDNIDRAEIFVKDAGLVLVKDEFIKILKSEGVYEIELLNKEFNPQFAECIEVVNGDKDNIVIEILQKGYMMGELLLRPAQVRVSKKSL